MSKDFRIKFIVLTSIVTFTFLALYYRTDYLILIISLVSSTIQILLFFTWYFEDSTLLNNIFREVVRQGRQRDEKDSYRQKIIRKIVNTGKIDEEEIKKILAKMENKDIIFFSLTESKIPKGLISKNWDQYPLRLILRRMRFIPVFFSYYSNANVWITFKTDLPPNLKSANNIKLSVDKELSNIWTQIQKYANENHPSKFEKWKTGEGFKVSYIIGTSVEHEFKIVYQNKHNFSEEFIARILKETTPEELKKVIPDKLEVKEIISKISIEILLDNIDGNIKEKLIKNEREISRNLKINSFLDYRCVNFERLVDEVNKCTSNDAEAKQVSSSIREEAQKFYDEIEVMGIMIS